MQKFERTLSITKIDEEQRMIYGYATTPDLDSDGEIISLQGIAKALPAYMDFPTIREMHQPVAVGVTKEATIKDGKGLWIGAKVVAQDAWEKVKEGVYSAFSIGGNVLEKVENVITALELIEISLVDVPANKAARIELWKSQAKGGDDMKKAKKGIKSNLRKDAYDAGSLAYIIDNLEWMIAREKEEGDEETVKALTAALAPLKEAVVSEIQEEDLSYEEQVVYVEMLNQRINSLKAIDFDGDQKADLIRKGVITAMTKVSDKIKKQLDDEEAAGSEAAQAEEGAESETEQTVADAAEEKETPAAAATEDAQAEEDKEEDGADEEDGEEDKTAGAEATDLKKIEAMGAELDKLSKVEKVEIEKSQPLAKTVEALTSTMEKMVSLQKEIVARLEQVEKAPAATKGKSALVFKSKAEEKEVTKDETVSPELATKKARVAELNKIYDEVGASEFAKRGHSMEASTLMNEIATLENQQGESKE